MEYIIGSHIVLNKFSAITLGNFDGIHLGHRKLIETVKEYKNQNLISIVASFLPHPKIVFKQKDFALILTHEEKRERISRMGIDVYIDFSFTPEFLATSAEDFAQKILFENLKCKVIVVGENYRFGNSKMGTPELLEAIGKKYDAQIITVPPVKFDGERVSSTRIRKLLANMELEKANELLGEPYSIIGTVVKGKQLGRALGFPTINILADPIKLFPVNGVYATQTLYNGIVYNSISNIGYDPTVNGKVKVIETNVLDFNKFVYGEKVEVKFLKFFRRETKFANIDELKNQIAIDTNKAKEYFKLNS